MITATAKNLLDEYLGSIGIVSSSRRNKIALELLGKDLFDKLQEAGFSFRVKTENLLDSFERLDPVRQDTDTLIVISPSKKSNCIQRTAVFLYSAYDHINLVEQEESRMLTIFERKNVLAKKVIFNGPVNSQHQLNEKILEFLLEAK